MAIEAGIVVRGGADFKTAQGRAKKIGVACVQSDEWVLPWQWTLFLSGEIAVRWELVSAGFHFLSHWDAAAPLLRYKAMANQVGSKDEQKTTLALVHDLRLLLYDTRLIFVRKSEAGLALVASWRAECGNGGENENLAFLRAMYSVKPLFCALPTTWVGGTLSSAARSSVASRARARGSGRAGNLVTVEIAPGRMVKCYAGTEDEVKKMWDERLRGRRG